MNIICKEINPSENIGVITQRAEKKLMPLIAHLDLTYRCNLKCLHCYCVNDSERAELTFPEIKSLLDQLAEAGALLLTVSGGEVFLREDIFDILEYAKGKLFAVSIFTNGTLLDEDKVKRLAALRPLSVELSLYGTGEKVHEKITGVAGSFEKTLRAIKLLKARNLRTVIKTMLMKENFCELENIFLFTKRENIELQLGVEITPKTDGSRAPLTHELDEKILLGYFAGDIPSSYNPQRELTVEEMANKPACGAARVTCAINPYGDIFPCSILTIPVGNIRAVPFKKIWSSSQPLLNSLRNIYAYGDLPDCSRCSLITHCRRCHGIAYLESGNFAGKSESACRYAKILKNVNQRFLNKEGSNGGREETLRKTGS
ncbi:MAG: radical SAM protein [Candidatus Omnitrophica bacterium]|nr:radical SAM protein [Candidatus Omnitrophota bacterium]